MFNTTEAMQIIVKSVDHKDKIYVIGKSAIIDITDFLRGSVQKDIPTNEKRVQLVVEQWK